MAGDAEFDQLYAQSRSRLVRQLFALTTDLADAEDIVQEAFTRAYLRWPRISTYEDPEAWVRSVAFRLGIADGDGCAGASRRARMSASALS